ncbi:choline/ethanolamine kinase family protein [Roseibium sp.]|uniref:choline/ethanolamine kinase family protein n=1 Tax=Roseibium sp. TaxID=1936156 RepID=UPI003A97B014
MTHFDGTVASEIGVFDSEISRERHTRCFCKSVLAAHPEAGTIAGEILEATRLPGLTNRVFRLATDRGTFVLRVPRPEMDGKIDRKAEWQDLLKAADIGVAVRPLYGDPGSGVILLPEVATSGQTTAPALGRCLATLHGSQVTFSRNREPVTYLEECEAEARRSGPLPERLQFLCRHLRGGLEGLAQSRSVPCHFDLSPGNILPQGESLILIDFEYAAMANAAWDLAYAVLEHGFDALQERELLKTYGEAGGLVPDPLELKVYRLNCDVISALWALAQLAQGNDADDFAAFADGRIKRALALVG